MKNKFERALLNNTTLTSENTTDKSAQETESLQHIPESYQKHPESSQQNPDSSQHNQNYVPICNFYKKGKCKHGIKGKNCNYRHPKACVKLMRYGNKNPKGCIAGSKCTDFHPRMCSSSIKTGECFNNTCAFVHVKGTKRKPSPKKNTSNNLPQSDFLKIFDNFRVDMLSIIHKKLKHTLHQTNLQTFPPKYPSQAAPQPPIQPRNLNFNQGNHLLNQQFQMMQR